MKKLFGVIMLMLLTALCAVGASATAPTVWDGTVATAFAGGTGTESDPYQIATAEQLAYLAQSVNSGEPYEGIYFTLTSDIALNDTTGEYWTAFARQWTPIGTYDNPFKGNLDGAGHTVTGLYINVNKQQVGLFGVTQNASFKNIGLIKADITGGRLVGALVGLGYANMADEAAYVSFLHCYLKDSKVNGNEHLIGGLVGCVSNGDGDGDYVDTIVFSDCYLSNSIVNAASYAVGGILGGRGTYGATITFVNCSSQSSRISCNDSYCGGIVGDSFDFLGERSFIINCYNYCSTITSSFSAGGIAGYSSGTIVTNCYNTGTVSGNLRVGGIVGNGSGQIKKCYNLGNIIGTALSATDTSCAFIGGIAGYVVDGTVAENCYYDKNSVIDTNGVMQNGIGSSDTSIPTVDIIGQTTALTEAEMHQQASFVGFDFNTIWIMGRGDYPYRDRLKFCVNQ